MLTIGRKDGESVVIGEDIRVVLIRSKHGSARIGIEAPADVKILRNELLGTEPKGQPPLTTAPVPE